MTSKRSAKSNLVDYSNDPDWEECRKVYSRSQQEFPIALGMWRVLQLKYQYYGQTPLHYISPNNLRKLNNMIIRKYYRLKDRLSLGMKVPPDIEKKGIYGKL